MDRRKFLRLSAMSSAGALFLNGQKVSAFSQTNLMNTIPKEVIDGRVLVLVQLRGGNDGLNTLIPESQYDDYARLRPTIKLKNSGSGAALSLDNTLDDAKKLLIHPSLTGLKSLYDEGKLNIIHSVGYPQINRSHFASRALMFQGGDGTLENSNKDDGWMARYLNAAYDYTQYEDPLGIQLGSQKPSLGFQSAHEHKVDVNLSKQNISGYYNIVSNIGSPEPEIPASDYGDALAYISNIEKSVNTYSQRVSEVFDVGLRKRANESTIVYPSGNELADQLKTVATLIRGGCKTKIYLVSHNGFDTHGGQVQAENETHKGTHADLLKDVGDALKYFQDDLAMLGVEDKVVSATFTEFGRKPAENGNLGTDHGNFGPMFVIGKQVKAGITGHNMDLSKVTEHFDATEMQHDYRQVFTSIIGDYLGAGDEVIQDTEFQNFATNRLDLIDNSEKTDEDTSLDDVLKGNVALVNPNPVVDLFTISYVGKKYFRGYIEIRSMAGSSVFRLSQDFQPRLNNIPVNISHIISGVYILAMYDESGKRFYRKKLIKL